MLYAQFDTDTTYHFAPGTVSIVVDVRLFGVTLFRHAHPVATPLLRSVEDWDGFPPGQVEEVERAAFTRFAQALATTLEAPQ